VGLAVPTCVQRMSTHSINGDNNSNQKFPPISAIDFDDATCRPIIQDIAGSGVKAKAAPRRCDT